MKWNWELALPSSFFILFFSSLNGGTLAIAITSYNYYRDNTIKANHLLYITQI